jgi:hypothetical protein
MHIDFSHKRLAELRDAVEDTVGLCIKLTNSVETRSSKAPGFPIARKRLVSTRELLNVIFCVVKITLPPSSQLAPLQHGGPGGDLPGFAAQPADQDRPHHQQRDAIRGDLLDGFRNLRDEPSHGGGGLYGCFIHSMTRSVQAPPSLVTQPETLEPNPTLEPCKCDLLVSQNLLFTNGSTRIALRRGVGVGAAGFSGGVLHRRRGVRGGAVYKSNTVGPIA